MSRELNRLRKENDELREQIAHMRDIKHVYRLAVTTQCGHTTTVKETYYTKKPDAMTDLEYEYVMFSGNHLDNYGDTVHACTDDASMTLTITKINILFG